MRKRLLCGLILIFGTGANAQWLNYPTPGTPRTKHGQPNLAAKAPRAPNGKPDLSGVWHAEYAPPGEIERLFGDVFKDFVVPGDDPRTFSKYFLNILADFKPEEAPLRPEAAALFQKHSQGGTREDPSTRCVPQGIPRGELDNYLPFKIIQTPAVIAVLYEESNTARYTLTAACFPLISNRRGWAIRSVVGRATRWSWMRQASTTRAGWMQWDTLKARVSRFGSGFTGVISVIWTWS
jgi:hypothetical protein